MKRLLVAFVCLALAVPAAAQGSWPEWPPRDYLLESLVAAVPGYLDGFHAETGRFGTEPWICQDQNALFPLAAAWAIDDPRNPYYHDDAVLEAIAKGGEALTDAMDEDGKWTFRKKDNSTWGQIHMPWTYSRWIRAYQLVGDALPEASRERWEKGLLLGFSGIRAYADGDVHNIPTHHAMALYIAGMCFDNDDWKQAAAAFMAKAVAEQDPVGFWSEHFGPVVGYNMVYLDALGVYYHFSKDPVALRALERSAHFHACVLWPDGSPVSAIDERQIYHDGVDIGNVGFSWTPEGRGYLLQQVARYSEGGKEPVSGDYAASMLLYGGTGESVAPAAAADSSVVTLGNRDALIQREKPWQWAFSAYACDVPDSRWIQDRQNLVDVFHDDLGLVLGGGNTKLQPYWSTFTVGDPALLAHQAGDESPDFTPDIDLRWTPDAATIPEGTDAATLVLRYGDVECTVTVAPQADGALMLTYHAPAGQHVEAHLPFLHRVDHFTTATGTEVPLTADPVQLDAAATGSGFTYGGLTVTAPEGATLRWPASQHNPYKKDGSSSLGVAKLVLSLPFDAVDTYTIRLSPAAAP